jgi:hypothetical protein
MLTCVFCVRSIFSADGIDVGHVIVEVNAVRDCSARCCELSSSIPGFWRTFLFTHSSVSLGVSVHFIHVYRGLTILIQDAI